MKKETENILKYEDFRVDLYRIWKVKEKVIPVNIRATEPISKPLRKYLSNVPDNHEIMLQKVPIQHGK